MAELNEQKIRRYFLGQLTEADGDQLEEEIASDEGLFLEAQAAEREMIDDHIRGNLSASDREAFEKVYLQGGRRRENLAAAASLWRVANENKGEARAASPAPDWRFWNNWRIALAGFGAILVVGGLVYLAYRSNATIETAGEAVNAEPPSMVVNVQNARPSEPMIGANENDNADNVLTEPTPKRSPSPSSTVKPPAPALATFTLRPGALRDEGEQSVTIPSDARTVGFDLRRPQAAPKYRTYSAAVRTADGDTVFTANGLRSLRFTLPAAKLESRTYVIFLEGQNGSGSSEPLAEYTFRVRR